MARSTVGVRRATPRRTRPRGALAFGQRLRAARSELGLSQDAVATDAGITRSHVSWLEHGNGWTTVQTLNRLARALKKHPSFFLYGKDGTSNYHPRDLAILGGDHSP